MTGVALADETGGVGESEAMPELQDEVFRARDGRSYARVAGAWWQLTDHEGRPALTGAVEPLEVTPIPPGSRDPVQISLLVCLLELYADTDVTPIYATEDEVFLVTDRGSVFAVKRGEPFRLFRRDRLPADARPTFTADGVIRHLAETCDELDQIAHESG